MEKYTLSIGNVGVLTYTNKKLAIKDFNDYVRQSKKGIGRAAGSTVELLHFDDTIKYHEGLLNNED